MRSFAHGTLIGLGATGLGSTGIIPGLALPWKAALLLGVAMAGISVLTSLASIQIPGSDPSSGSFLPSNPGAVLKLLSNRRQDE